MCQRTLFRIILGLLGLCTNLAGTNASSLVHLDPPRIVASYGSTISANCSTNIDYQTMNWEVPLGTVREAGLKTMTWTVKNLTEWDMKPFCFINVDMSKQEKLPLSLTVYKTPDRVLISTVKHTGPMVEDQQYELQCYILEVAPVKFLTVNWYKGETLVGNTSFTDSNKTPLNRSATIKITPKRDDNGVQYKCEAVLDLGPEGPQPPPAVMSDPLSIIAYYGPEISCPNHITVKQGEKFTPNCTVDGFPTPEVTWYKDGDTVDFPQNMSRNEAGQYVLIANSSSNASHTVDIEVLYAPYAIEELKNKTIDQGYYEGLKCSSVSNPRPDYRWIYPQEVNVNIENIDGVSLLFIDYATVQNTGTYTCIAHNQLGETSKSVRVDVQDTTNSVSLNLVDPLGAMIEGRQYELRCHVQYAAPVNHITINWYKGTTLVHSEDFPQPTETARTQKDQFATLLISHNRTDNGAQYKCVAELKPKAGGSHRFNITSNVFNITVHYRPIINTNKLPSVVPVFRGYPEVLVCEAEGSPQPDIKWTFKTITSEGGNYTIEEATNENVGVYNCTASNSVDSTVRVVKVILKEDYLPLIAGFVALVVVIISVFFIIIYSIYYKNTKMGHYMVEGAKPNAQNGNVAQNGKDSAIPMHTLTQNSYV